MLGETITLEVWKDFAVTFAGTDHLQHHLGGSTRVQPGLLIQDLLLFHLLLLCSRHTLASFHLTELARSDLTV